MTDTPLQQKIADAKQYLSKRKRAYLSVFKTPDENVEDVLRDLAKFCRANTSTFHPDPRAHAVMEGRREVWLRIANHLHLTTDELYRLLGENKR